MRALLIFNQGKPHRNAQISNETTFLLKPGQEGQPQVNIKQTQLFPGTQKLYFATCIIYLSLQHSVATLSRRASLLSSSLASLSVTLQLYKSCNCFSKKSEQVSLFSLQNLLSSSAPSHQLRATAAVLLRSPNSPTSHPLVISQPI